MSINAIRQSLGKDILVIGGARLLPVAASIIGLKITTSALSPMDYGLAILIITAAQLSNAALSSWIGYILVRYFQKYQNLSQSESFVLHFGAVQACMAGMGLLCLGGWAAVAHWDTIFTNTSLCVILLAYGAILPLAVFLQTILQLNSQRKRLFVQISAGALISLFITIIGFKYFQGGSGVLVGATLATVIPTLIFEVPSFFRNYSFKTFNLDRVLLVEGFKYGLPQILVCASVSILATGDRFFLEYFHGPAAMGAYAACYRLGEMIINLPSTIVCSVAAPLLVKCYQEHGIDAAGIIIGEILGMFFAVFLPLLIIVSVEPKWVASLILNPSYSAQAHLIPFITGGVFLFSLTQIVGMPFQLFEKPMLFVAAIGTGGMVAVLINISIVPKFALLGAALSCLFGYFCYISILLAAIRIFLGMSINLRDILKPMVAAAGAACTFLVPWDLPYIMNGESTHFLQSIFFGFIYCALLIAIKYDYAIKIKNLSIQYLCNICRTFKFTKQA